MNYSSLFEPKYLLECPTIEKVGKLSPNVIRMNIEGNESSSRRALFARLHMQGRILAFFESTPKIETPPCSIVNIQSVIEIGEIPIKDENVLILKLKGESIGLLFEKSSDRSDWLETLRSIIGLYNPSSQREIDSRTGSETATYFEARIRSELEGASFSTIAKNFDYSNFCRDKGLKDLLDYNHKLLKNRLIICQCKFDAKVPQVNPASKTRSQPQSSVTPVKFSVKVFNDDVIQGKNIFILLTSPKPAAYIDQTTMFTDYAIMGQEALPKDIEFNSLYFYNYESVGDVTDVKKVLPVRFSYKRGRKH
jgi:hypothetical protein